VLVSAAPLPSSDGLARHAVVHVLDMTERKRFEQQLRQLADHDALTGLYNRRRFDAELERTLALARRYGGRGALVLLDIDGFKFVNDTQGHSAGDELVVRIGTILAAQLRTTDVLGRVGGDEFCVLLPEVDEAEAVLVAEKILHAIRRQATVERPGRLPRITASAGIATYGNRPGSITAEDLTATADMAMYDAKDRGRDRVAVYAEGDQPRTRLTDRAEWTSRLEAAVADDRFRLVAQPIVGITANGVPRAELLLRYLGDDGRLVAPGVFLYLAERSDLICQIDRWVLSEAVRHLGDVHERGRDLALAVNLSARTLVDPDLPVYLEGLLASRRIPAGRLVIEVTETAAIVNIDRARRFADDLHRLGCRLALDDFGSGFASFYYLKHLAFDYVKIDGEFIKHLPENRTDRLVVEAVVGIARGLGTRTVAEFVGSPEVVQVLEELGVDYGQGYHLGMPAPVEELLEDVVRAPRFAPGAAGLPVAPPQAVGPDDG
jgi:diguanylate cyclase (GGDEF)-like protein